MTRKIKRLVAFISAIFILVACNLPGEVTEMLEPQLHPTELPNLPAAEISPAAIQHVDVPISAPEAQPYPDVVSSDTADEKRAPYGDSYDLNRLERPFSKEMIYLPDVDITMFGISGEGPWYFVSFGLMGNDPNNPDEIHYGVELDVNRDGFGDYLILARPPFSAEWTAENVSVFADTDTNTAGTDPQKSDAPLTNTNGYDQLIYSTEDGVGDDADIAWVRMEEGPNAILQFAFKKSLSGFTFLYGVMADAGLKDVARLDYVDSFTEAQAGSPVRDNPNYPLKDLYAVDNTCFQAQGFDPTGYESKICPEIVQSAPMIAGEDSPGGSNGSFIFTPVDLCSLVPHPDPANCKQGWAGFPSCDCIH